MAVKYEIEWTEEASADLEKIYNFLLLTWGDRKAEEFLNLVFEFEEIILRFPQAFKRSRKIRTCYRGLVHPNTTVDKIKGHKLRIVTLFDNRSSSKNR